MLKNLWFGCKIKINIDRTDAIYYFTTFKNRVKKNFLGFRNRKPVRVN